MRKSPLHDLFEARGAVFQEIGGCAVATTVAGVDAEATAIRSGIGIWDHSDMGKIRVAGDAARETIGRTVTGDVERLAENSIRYTLILDDDGRILSDVQVYNNFDEYMITCGAAVKDRVLEALRSRNSAGAEIEDISERYAAICCEGPRAWKIPTALTGMDVRALRLLTFTQCDHNGVTILLSRIGYCGEFGYIFFVPAASGPDVLTWLLEQNPDAVLCGRAVQDVLRLEMRSFNLNRDVPGGESPLEAGLHWMFDFRKDDFTGRAAVFAEKNQGLKKKLVAFEVDSDGLECGVKEIFDGASKVGYVVNSAYSPRRGRTIGVAYLDEPYGWVGMELTASTGSEALPIRTVSAPFVLAESNRVQIS